VFLCLCFSVDPYLLVLMINGFVLNAVTILGIEIRLIKDKHDDLQRYV
jgi:hypothetical protein